jgi:hypothetical protein
MQCSKTIADSTQRQRNGSLIYFNSIAVTACSDIKVIDISATQLTALQCMQWKYRQRNSLHSAVEV